MALFAGMFLLGMYVPDVYIRLLGTSTCILIDQTFQFNAAVQSFYSASKAIHSVKTLF